MLRIKSMIIERHTFPAKTQVRVVVDKAALRLDPDVFKTQLMPKLSAMMGILDANALEVQWNRPLEQGSVSYITIGGLEPNLQNCAIQIDVAFDGDIRDLGSVRPKKEPRLYL
jgi:hypothetical protein